MKKTILLLFVLISLIGCASSENYSKETKTLVCTQPYTNILETNGEVVDENYREGIMERTFWIEEGLLIKQQTKYITSISEYEDVESELVRELDFYENVVHEFEGLSTGKPYIDGDNFVGPIFIEDYTNLDPYLEREYIPHDVLNKKGNAIIFDLYYDKFVMNEEFNKTLPTCSIKK